MAQREDSGFKSYEADEAIELYSRVKMDADGKITKAGLVDICIGTLQTHPANAAGEWVPVKLVSAAGTHKVRVSEAITIGSLVYSEADGEVQDTAASTSYIEGRALGTSTAADDIIEMVFVQTGVVVP